MDRFKLFARFSAILAMLVEYTAIISFVHQTGTLLHINQPISYFSTLPATHTIFATAFILAAMLAGVFGYWLYGQYPLNKKFGIVYSTVLVSQMVFAVVPDSGSWQILHLFAALLVGFLMPIIIYMFITQANPKRFRKSILKCFYFQVVAFLTLVLTHGQFILINEVFLGAAFHFWAILATFDSPSA